MPMETRGSAHKIEDETEDETLTFEAKCGVQK